MLFNYTNTKTRLGGDKDQKNNRLNIKEATRSQSMVLKNIISEEIGVTN